MYKSSWFLQVRHVQHLCGQGAEWGPRPGEAVTLHLSHPAVGDLLNFYHCMTAVLHAICVLTCLSGTADKSASCCA